jgi:hypothetical protein
VTSGRRPSLCTPRAPEDERGDHSVIELTGDRDEVRHEIEGQREVARQREERLPPAGHARVAEQPTTEDDAVGDEAGERAGALASADDDESENKRGVRDQERADSDERPCEDVHPNEPRGRGWMSQ